MVMPEESIESIALFEYEKEFTPEELAEAKRRLVDCGLFERCYNQSPVIARYRPPPPSEGEP
jgi:hypothetical protein